MVSLPTARHVLTELAAMCQMCSSSITLHKWDSATRILFPDTWMPTRATLSLCRTRLAQSMLSRWVPAEPTLLQMCPTLQIQPKVPRRACGRHCRVSWVLSRTTLPMESTSLLRAMVATTDRYSTSKCCCPLQWHLPIFFC